MSTSINFIHTEQKIDVSNGDYIYKYTTINNKNYWVKTTSKLHKLYSTTSIGNYDFDMSLYNENDYIIGYNTVTNHIKYSENFNIIDDEDTWKNKNIKIDTNNGIQSTLFSNIIPHVSPINYNTDSFVSQKLIVNSNSTIKFSTFVFVPRYIEPMDISLGIINESLNIGVFARTTFKNNIYIKKELLDNNYNVKHNQYVDDNSLCKINLIDTTKSFYVYKLMILQRVVEKQILTLKLNLINDNGKYIFNHQMKNKIFLSGFQAEMYDNSVDMTTILNDLTPYVYNNTNQSKSQTYLDKIFQIILEDEKLTPNEKDISIHFVTETEMDKFTVDNQIYTYIKNTKPQIIDYNLEDIIIVSNILNFYHQTINGIATSPIKIGSTCDRQNDPLYSMYYDKQDKTYKIKTKEYTENGIKKVLYENLQSNKSKTVSKSITHALIYNQGYFETWSRKGKCIYKHGYNTGGGYNFWKRK